MTYKLYKSNHSLSEPDGVIYDDGNGSISSFLFDSNNPDYQQYLAWLEEGNEPLPPDPEPTPEPLTAQQKLEAAGLTIEELKGLLGL